MQCPFCKQEILDGAIKCKHCHRMLNEAQEKLSIPESPHKSRKTIISKKVVALLIIPVIILLVAAVIYLLQPSNKISDKNAATRYGVLSINTDKILLFNGQPYVPELQGNSGLIFVDKFQLDSSDVVLIMDIGGTACPAEYYFISVSKSGAKVTPSFGTCSELYKATQRGNSITVTMPGFLGSSESEENKEKANNEMHTFIYENGEVAEINIEMIPIPRKNYSIGKYEVTQGQWQAVMGSNPSYLKNCKDCPVESVSWDDCQMFIRKLNELTGKGYRLPTEAEWEYACRAGTTGELYGDLDAIAWHMENSGKMPQPVGHKQPNAFGLYDMIGNVWEWCQDAIGSDRVYRGGGWINDAGGVRVSSRVGNNPGYRSFFLGFRLALGESQAK